ncbi:putative UPF0481 protein At3g02645 [Mercurialis annua]|uniref:putative UPF0481 protein At3g02645 n=1 Tax=Mercurialis annua TaxID=3986 RepID=UPI0021600F08|nr:putative UPF0481 protein At3g02645 [Mercurialis annua]
MQMDAQKMACGDSVIDMDMHILASGDSVINSNFDEEKWRSKMKSMLDKEPGRYDRETDDNTISILRVPGSVKALKPEAYTPQTIALGPCHHFLPKLYKMQNCKIHQVRIFRQERHLPEFQLLFDQMKRKVRDVRGYYYESLSIHDDTLSLIIVLDGLFLLQLIYGIAERYADSLEFSDSLGRKFSLDAILNDIVMIENQIPFFVLEHIAYVSGNKSLLDMSAIACAKFSPIVLRGIFVRRNLKYPFHLLDLLYNLVCFGGFGGGASDMSVRDAMWCDLWDIIKALNITFLAIPIKIIDLLLRIFRLFGISFSLPDEEAQEKALVPTASQLSSVKVEFCSISLGVRFIDFVKHTSTLSLPSLKLNLNSEVVIRNLLAYEAIAKPETPNFARYIELIATLTRTAEDVELLKSVQILVHDGDNSEVLKLLSGIRSTIASEGKPDFECSIKDLNKYYDNHWKIKVKKVIKKYVYSSWKILTILATILLLLLMALQTFCSIYTCQGIFKKSLNLASSF